MTSIEYLSGFFDADGTIGIYDNGNTIKLSVTQKHPSVLYEFRKRWEGTLYHHPDGHWQWFLTGVRALRAILEMNPYLIEKRRQAALCADYLELVGIQGKKMTDENRIARQRLESELKSLKRTGNEDV